MAGKVLGHWTLAYDRPSDPKGFYRFTFKPAARGLGMPELHLHELRHTFATLMLESGAFDSFALSRLTGHASYAVTDKVCGHVRKRDYKSQRERFSAMVAGGKAGSAVTPLSPALAGS